MKEINISLIRKCANDIMLDMSDEQCELLLEEFNIIFSKCEALKELDGIAEVEPMVFPFDCESSFLRDDIEGEVLHVEDILNNVKDVQDNQIKIPKVI